MNYVKDGAAIYRESFSIIRREADLSAFQNDFARVVVRMIHACGMTDLPQDVLASPDGRVQHFEAKRIPGIDPHGTGCTYSAAIAAGLARGLTLTEAVLLGKWFITRALSRRFEIGPYQLLNHLR